MIDPQLLFQEPNKYLEFLTSSNEVEGQYFDRKEVRNNNKKELNQAKENIKTCISAFANSRGGVLVLGINNGGAIIGLDHLNEQEYNSLPQIMQEGLINHQSQTKEFYENNKKLLLIYTPEALYGICETSEQNPKGWKREGANNLPLTQEDKQRLILEKSKKYEQLATCDFDASLLNKNVLEEFKKSYQDDRSSSYSYEHQEFLKLIGACKIENGKLVFTNAGFLFFASNPRSLIPSTYVRFLKYDSSESEYENPGTAIFDEDFDGCLPELLQKIRTFIKNGAFFKRYSYRDPNGSGIIEEPEYPYTTAEEAIVNAIVHRDYNVSQPILCIAYKDAFVVRNPGKIPQPSFIPTKFTLENQRLEHYPRNPKIMEWARIMRDESGQRFVKALSEGTRSMLEAMNNLNLSAPEYITNGNTTVILRNDFENREGRFRKLSILTTSEFANLFPINITFNEDSNYSSRELKASILSLLRDKLQNTGWFIDWDKASRVVAHRKGNSFEIHGEANKFLKIFPAFVFQIYSFDNRLYLSIDYDIQIKNIATIETLSKYGITDFRHRSAQVKVGDSWTTGVVEDTTEYYARVILSEFENIDEISTSKIIPSLNKSSIKLILRNASIDFDFDRKIKEFSLASKKNASKERAEKIVNQAKFTAKEIFPLSYNGFRATLASDPVSLIDGISSQGQLSPPAFSVFRTMKEPEVRFDDNHTESNILSGITRFGSYDDKPMDLEVIPFCLSGYEDKMQTLLNKLQQGSMKFKGIERTFNVRLSYPSINVKEDAQEYLVECKRLLDQYAGWEGNSKRDRIFLVHVPEDKYPATDIQSPYYDVKEFLLENGIPTQMIDTPTLDDPSYKDLNLALNIAAKVGKTPWVLPNALPDADLFIGLSYTEYKDESQLYRTMGYANVFNKYGRWQYYKGNAAAFDYDSKHIHISNLVKETLQNLSSLPESPSIHIHYSAKFSRKDREAILDATNKIRPKARLTFVWQNTGHNIRLFDNKTETNGSLSRGSYVVTRPRQFYLSTTGYNTLSQGLGTPIMLEVNVQTEPSETFISHRNISQHLLALTKLNWASTQSIIGEPVTIKYARDIARLSSAFLRRRGTFKLHKVLEQTPWFL